MSRYEPVAVGKRYGRWLVVNGPERLPRKNRPGYYRVRWWCRCDCGVERWASADGLKSGHTQSCGCLSWERSAAVLTTHGDNRIGKRARLYSIWRGMLHRTANPSATQYQWYGARGITVCPEWQKYESFREWALSNGYADSLTINRIDNDGNYEPDNCEWITQERQAHHKRTSLLITAFGETKTATDWSRDSRCVVPYGTLYQRIRHPSGRWPTPELAITTP